MRPSLFIALASWLSVTFLALVGLVDEAAHMAARQVIRESEEVHLLVEVTREAQTLDRLEAKLAQAEQGLAGVDTR